MPNRIKVFIVDDHLIVREGITSILEIAKDIEVVGQASNAQETLSQISKLVPDIVLMDLKMPGVDGIQLTRLVKNKLPTCKVVILTLYDQYVDEAMKAGASGYLLKDTTLEDLVDAIKRVYGGAEVYDKNIRPVIKIDYEERPEEENKHSPGADAKESSGDISTTLYDQVKVFILPPANIGDALRLTSVVEEALSGDFKQVEGTQRDGISITFNLNNPLHTEEINWRLSKISHIKTLNQDMLAAINDSRKIIEDKHKFDMKHPAVKTIFIQLPVQD
ncbi:MAG: response regulator transcription factor [Dehalococcoidales bacterium]|nr:response regulator transcription factor [Dehalococcoidales bacterium]